MRLVPEVHEDTVTVGSVTTRVLRAGGPAGRGLPILLLLHGFGDSADTWRPLLAHLPLRKVRVVAPDLPGFGHADALERAPLMAQWEQFLDDLIDLIDDRAPVIVGGNSLGGLLTLRAALAGRVAGAIAIAPGGVEAPARWTRMLQHGVVMRRLLAIPSPWPRRLLDHALTRVYLTAGFHEPGAVDPVVTATFIDHLGDKRTLRRLMAVASALAREVASTGELALETVDCPVLVIWGLNDRLLSPTGADVVSEVVRDADTVRLAGCGHCPQVEQPAAVAKAIAAFLPRVTGRAADEQQSGRVASPRRR